MAPHDSDSSGDEQDDYTETNVLLGYASKEPEDISHLGGRPEWLDPDSPPSAALARCKVCKDLMVLLLQLNAELPAQFPGHERRLYVFACRRKTCRRKDGSIRVVRGVKAAPGSSSSTSNDHSAAATTTTSAKVESPSKPEPKQEPKPPSNLGETLFGAKTLGSSGSANPFSTSNGSGSNGINPFASPSNNANPFSSTPVTAARTEAPEKKNEAQEEQEKLDSLPKTFAETLSLNNPQQQQTQPTPPSPPEPWPEDAAQPRPYPVSYLTEAEYETLDPTPAPVSQATIQMDVEEEGGPSPKGNNSKTDKEDKKVFESSMDADFQKFADRLAQNPEQAIRYEFGGQPLLYAKEDAVGVLFNNSNKSSMPRCGNCGARRTFEVQLCPHAIFELEADEMSLEDGMDWGTVLVGVCERDCQARAAEGEEGRASYLEEWAGVQWEELTGSGRR